MKNGTHGALRLEFLMIVMKMAVSWLVSSIRLASFEGFTMPDSVSRSSQ